MAKKKRKRGMTPNADDDAPASAPPAPAIGTAIGALLKHAGLEKVKEPKPGTVVKPARTGARPPPPPLPLAQQKRAAQRPAAPALDTALTPGERSALNSAYRGVQPIKRKTPGRVARAAQPVTRTPVIDPEEQSARERLSALVAGGVRFAVRWEGGFVEGLREGVSEKQLRRLGGAGFAAEATLDLHGMRREEAERAVHDFVREAGRTGARYLLVIVGKGLHSEDGRGVLAESLVHALTKGFSAPRVQAFASAADRHGGRGAIAVELK